MMSNQAVSAVCKRCGRTAKSTEFVLDNVYKLMVCPQCVKERKERQRDAEKQAHDEVEAEKVQAEKKTKPAGWDHEDEYLEKVEKQRQKNQLQFERLDSERVMLTCPKCEYKFKFNTVKKSPKLCPYCGTVISSK